MTLMEVMVAIAIALALMLVLVPSVSAIFELRQREAAKRIVLLYHQLHDQAVLRNTTFRVTYDLSSNSYKVESTDKVALIYSDPEERKQYESELRSQLLGLSEEERAQMQAQARFQTADTGFSSQSELPAGVRLYGVYTPQYGKMVTLDDVDPRSEESLQVHSYVFANGFAEHTLIWIVDEDDHTRGWTVEIEPLSGRVHLHGELVDWQDSQRFVPRTGPSLPS